jgi:hypothetical protein
MSSVIAAATARTNGTNSDDNYDNNQSASNVDDFLTDFEVEVQTGESTPGDRDIHAPDRCNKCTFLPPSASHINTAPLDDVGPLSDLQCDDDSFGPPPPRAPLRRQLTEGSDGLLHRGLQQHNKNANDNICNNEGLILAAASPGTAVPGGEGDDDDAAFLAEMELLTGGEDV